MTPRLIDVMVFALTRPARVMVVLAGVTIAGAVADVLLRERCGLCRERVRVPLEAHWLVDHAGDPR